MPSFTAANEPIREPVGGRPGIQPLKEHEHLECGGFALDDHGSPQQGGYRVVLAADQAVMDGLVGSYDAIGLAVVAGDPNTSLGDGDQPMLGLLAVSEVEADAARRPFQ